ncbi:receptor-interacting serine/threonine-protein kinase 4-like isoform X2 [Schistocerca serialis cubense]|uniref:receptor-interacting serine/threonine-protein kinase 4-like isoform X2 n=1 Tax=Schistocerca serialis cubense TaxID=2023355 RepID=UPI00214E239A|nr:receptor-interacting serine/threonine-protein kinase 4-like isoform X2 [Schistocerca serialis cubense]
MFCRSISWFICILVAVVIAANCSDSDSITGPDLEVNVLRLRSGNPGQSTVEPETEAKETPTVGLSALLDAGEGAVVTLVAGDTRLAAHRAVLASRSPVFEAMFRHEPLEASSGQVAVQDVEGPVLRQLLAYLYTLQAPRLPGMSAQLLAAADKYGVSALKAECELQLAAQLSVETAAAAAALAVRHSSDSLKQAAIKFIRAHLVQVIFTPGWADAVRSQPQDMADVYRLLLETPMETRYADAHREANTGTPLQTPSNTTAQRQRPTATADGRTTPATELHSNRGWTSVTAAPPTTLHSTLWPDGSTASTLHTPASTESSVTPTTQLQSNQGDLSRTSASAATPTAASPTPSTDSAAITLLSSPATADSRTTPSTQPLSDHSWSRDAAAPTTMSTHDTPPPDSVAIALLRTLSGEEKGRRLIQAAILGSMEELQALLAAGANVGARDMNEWTPLHWAAGRGYEEMVRRLLVAGADVRARDKFQQTPLHLAAWGGRPAVVRLLSASSADPNARDVDGWTPLHSAAFNDETEAATALLEAGADRGAIDNNGRTPLDIARQYNQQQVIDVL